MTSLTHTTAPVRLYKIWFWKSRRQDTAMRVALRINFASGSGSQRLFLATNSFANLTFTFSLLQGGGTFCFLGWG